MPHFARPCISLLHRSTWNTTWQRTATCRDLLGDNSALESVLQWPMAAWCNLLQRQLSGLGGGAGSSRRGLHYLLCLLFCPFPAFLTLLRLCCGFSPLNLCFLLPATSFAPRSRLNACVSPDFKTLKPPPQCDDIWGWSL